jgi:hypothetical protein
MELDEKMITIAITLALLGSFLPVIADQEYPPKPMNASISQPICIELSGNLSQGIFFTNTTTIGVQYPITNMTAANNATGNYWGEGGGTVYWVKACSGNTINVTVYQSACENLKNGTNTIYLTFDSGDGGQGGFIGNSTASATAPTLSETEGYAMLVDSYKLVIDRIAPVGLGGPEYGYLRYWLDPWPNSAPSGTYNTTYKIKAVELGVDPGSGGC